MKKAIITYSPQDTSYSEAFEKVVVPRLEYLAKKWETELIISNTINPKIKIEQLNNSQFYPQYLNYNKSFILKSLINKFDRVLYLDPFMVVSRTILNIFDLYIPDNFYAVLDASVFDKPCHSKTEEMVAVQAILGSINWFNTYYNTSFMLLNSEHHKIFEDDEYKIFLKGFSHTKINYYLNKYKFPHTILSREFNSSLINIADHSASINGMCPPEVLAKNSYIVNTDHISSEFKNDYIFKLNSIME